MLASATPLSVTRSGIAMSSVYSVLIGNFLRWVRVFCMFYSTCVRVEPWSCLPSAPTDPGELISCTRFLIKVAF